VGGVGLMLAVLLFGVRLSGANWLGASGLRFQPSEFARSSPA
jgi:cell division protein FtsW (lipid II flippase)